MVPIKMDEPLISQQNAYINNNLNINQDKNSITQSNLEQIPYPRQIDREQKITMLNQDIEAIKILQGQAANKNCFLKLEGQYNHLLLNIINIT